MAIFEPGVSSVFPTLECYAGIQGPACVDVTVGEHHFLGSKLIGNPAWYPSIARDIAFGIVRFGKVSDSDTLKFYYALYPPTNCKGDFQLVSFDTVFLPEGVFTIVSDLSCKLYAVRIPAPEFQTLLDRVQFVESLIFNGAPTPDQPRMWLQIAQEVERSANSCVYPY